MTKEHSLLRRFFFGSKPSWAERKEKVLRYIIHRIYESDLRKVLEESYVRRSCSQIEIEETRSNPQLVHAARDYLKKVFRSGELNRWQAVVELEASHDRAGSDRAGAIRRKGMPLLPPYGTVYVLYDMLEAEPIRDWK